MQTSFRTVIPAKISVQLFISISFLGLLGYMQIRLRFETSYCVLCFLKPLRRRIGCLFLVFMKYIWRRSTFDIKRRQHVYVQTTDYRVKNCELKYDSPFKELIVFLFLEMYFHFPRSALKGDQDLPLMYRDSLFCL